MKSYQKNLQSWSKKEFGNNKIQLDLLHHQLSILQGQLPSKENSMAQSQVTLEVKTLLLREEMFLHQRSRIHWLNFGHKNSAFFHATVHKRRQRNQLVKLKNEEGE